MLGTAHEAVTVDSVAAEVGKEVAAVLSVNNIHSWYIVHTSAWNLTAKTTTAIHISTFIQAHTKGSCEYTGEPVTRGAVPPSGFSEGINSSSPLVQNWQFPITLYMVITWPLASTESWLKFLV